MRLCSCSGYFRAHWARRCGSFYSGYCTLCATVQLSPSRHSVSSKERRGKSNVTCSSLCQAQTSKRVGLQGGTKRLLSTLPGNHEQCRTTSCNDIITVFLLMLESWLRIHTCQPSRVSRDSPGNRVPPPPPPPPLPLQRFRQTLKHDHRF